MPFRAKAPFLHDFDILLTINDATYQCPLELVLHFYKTDDINKQMLLSCINAPSG